MTPDEFETLTQQQLTSMLTSALKRKRLEARLLGAEILTLAFGGGKKTANNQMTPEAMFAKYGVQH